MTCTSPSTLEDVGSCTAEVWASMEVVEGWISPGILEDVATCTSPGTLEDVGSCTAEVWASVEVVEG